MVKNKNNGVTLEDLANMVAKGFEQSTDDLHEVKSGLNKVKSELGEVKRDVGILKFKVDDVYDILARFEENDILNLQKRVQILEKAVRSLANQISK
ncbi:MAG: hypothetical protein WD989_02310 [Candidatus Paceibacterota bacterium]